MAKRTNWTEVGAGVLLMVGTTMDVIPGDEVIGVPLGALLVAHGFGVL